MDLYRYHYAPTFAHKLLSYALLPISVLYGSIATSKRVVGAMFARVIYGRNGRDFGVPIISVGNLIAGGSGKTPCIIELAKHLAIYTIIPAPYQTHTKHAHTTSHETHTFRPLHTSTHIVIISRGYKRKSKGLVWVSKHGEVLVDSAQSGDEPYLIATALAGLNTSVIVSASRAKAIKLAKNANADIVLLDDGFRFNFYKLDIILRPSPEPFFHFFLPSGLYRESFALYRKLQAYRPESNSLESTQQTYTTRTLIAQEGREFVRKVRIINPTAKMFLLSAIANPQRLIAFLPPHLQAFFATNAHVSKRANKLTTTRRDTLDSTALESSSLVGYAFFPDHHRFSQSELEAIMKAYAPSSILTTTKDATKLHGYTLSIMELRFAIQPRVLCAVRAFIDVYRKTHTLIKDFTKNSVRAESTQIESIWRFDSIGDYLYRKKYCLQALHIYNKSAHNVITHNTNDTHASPTRSPIAMLGLIERRIFTSLIRPHLLESITKESATKKPSASEPNSARAFDLDSSGVRDFSNARTNLADMSVSLFWLWLPCGDYGGDCGDYGSDEFVGFHSRELMREAFAILENAFCDGLIDFWLDGSFYDGVTPTESLAQSFKASALLQANALYTNALHANTLHAAWKYLYDAFLSRLFIELCGDVCDDDSTLIKWLDERYDNEKLNPSDIAQQAQSHTDSTTQNSLELLHWDNPALFSLSTLRIGLTKKGLDYCATTLALSSY